MKIELKLEDIVGLLNGNTISVQPGDPVKNEILGRKPIEIVIDEPMDTFYSRLAKKLEIPQYFVSQLRDKIGKL